MHPDQPNKNQLNMKKRLEIYVFSNLFMATSFDWKKIQKN